MFFSNYAKAILQILDEDDFEKDLYKTYLLHVIFISSCMEVEDLVLPEEDRNKSYKEYLKEKSN